MSSTLRESYEVNNATLGGPSGNTWCAMTFVASAVYLIDEVQLYCRKVATGSSGTFTVSIRTVDANHLPTGGDLVAKAIAWDALTTTMEWKSWVFDTPYQLTRGVEYAIVFREATNTYCQWYVDTNQGYATGLGSNSSNAGASWADASQDRDFRTFGEEIAGPFPVHFNL